MDKLSEALLAITVAVFIFSYFLPQIAGVASAGSKGTYLFQAAGAAVAQNTTFYETGLPGGATWYISFGNLSINATAPAIIKFQTTNTITFSVYNVKYNGTVFTPDTYSSSASPGANEMIDFAANTVFAEIGLPTNATWSVKVANNTEVATAPGNILFNLPYGSYNFSVNNMGFDNVTYYPNVSTGVTVAGRTTTLSFGTQNATVFVETGLPKGTKWYVTYNNTDTAFAHAPNKISFTLESGTYAFSINSIQINGKTYAPKIQKVNIASGTEYDVNFTLMTAFHEIGLPGGATWSITYDNISTSASAPDGIGFAGVNGNYTYVAYNTVYNATTYVPSVYAGTLQSGFNTTIGFSNGASTGTTNIITSTTSTTTVPVTPPQTPSGHIVQTANLHNTAPGINVGTVLAHNSIVKILPSESVLTGISVNLTQSGTSFNVIIQNGTSLQPPVPLNSTPVYQYIQINGTLAGSSTNIDDYISNVTYNFTVPISWADSYNASGSNIGLFKYTQNGWAELPTAYVGTNATDYFYAATSNSFSVYAVGIITSSGSGSVAAENNIYLTMTPGFNQYFFAGAGKVTHSTSSTDAPSVNWTQVANSFATSTSSSHRHSNVTSVGYTPSTQLTGNIAVTDSRAVTGSSWVIAGIGANVIEGNGNVVISQNAGSNVMTFTYGAAVNSIVLVMVASAGNSFVEDGTSGTNALPAGCRIDTWLYLRNASVETANCVITSTGTITTNFITMGKGAAATAGSELHPTLSGAVFVFPPYSVSFNAFDGGSVVEGGTTLSNQIDDVIGTATLNAVAPVGESFTGWVASSPSGGVDPGNFIIADPGDANTYITVMGNGIITATFGQSTTTTFTENGLPSVDMWNVIYDGVLESSSTNTIIFTGISAGTYSVLIVNQTGVNRNVYRRCPVTLWQTQEAPSIPRSIQCITRRIFRQIPLSPYQPRTPTVLSTRPTAYCEE